MRVVLCLVGGFVSAACPGQYGCAQRLRLACLMGRLARGIPYLVGRRLNGSITSTPVGAKSDRSSCVWLELIPAAAAPAR